MTPRTALALLALAGLTIAACGSDDSTGSADAVSPADLSNRGFTSTEVTGYDLVDGSEITMNFVDDSVSINAGCNTMNGGYEITDGAFTAGPFASTMMACPDPLMAQDLWLSEFLAGSPAIALDGSTLTLTGDGATITLDEIEAAELTDTTWVVTGTVANEAVSSVPADSSALLKITPEGIMTVNAGCNNGSGEVEVTDTTMTVSPIAVTKKLCPPEQMTLETAVLETLQGEVTYEINGDNLSLRSGEGADAIGLELTAQR